MNSKIVFLDGLQARFFVCLLCSILLCSCSGFNSRGERDVDFRVAIAEDNDRVRFSGKGAGAGVMLMSSMGPMGIAIGVAIDEGIGKDIDATAKSGELNIVDVVKNAFNAALVEQNDHAQKEFTIRIDRYGFVARNGEGDPVIAQLHLTINDSTVLLYPEGVDDESQLQDTAQLDQIKTDTAAIVEQYALASRWLARNWLKNRP